MVNEYSKYQKYADYVEGYRKASNAATGSAVDSNANVENKNVTTLSSELFKPDEIGVCRKMMSDKLTEMFGEEIAEQYLRDLEHHIIYKHDETHSQLPYCASITLYPFLHDGLAKLGGISSAPKNLEAFCGSFINLGFAVSAQLAGACATPEFLTYLDYFIRKKYGDDYIDRADQVADLSQKGRTLDKVITDCFEQVVYSLNQPAAARGYQSVFWNLAYFDRPYFEEIFRDFVFPDGDEPKWETTSWLQKRFMKWFNAERLRKPLTFPVETVNLLNDGKGFVDQEWADFAAEMYAEGHSFFTYTSSSVDALASCCRLKNMLVDNVFSYTLGAGGISTGSKCVITMNINRIVQDAVREGVDISERVREIVQRVHKYLLAYNEMIKDNLEAGLLPLYDAGFISMERQYLTCGINGVPEAAEFLGLKVSDNDDYKNFVESILKPIYAENQKDRTKDVLWNTEFVPSYCGHCAA